MSPPVGKINKLVGSGWWMLLTNTVPLLFVSQYINSYIYASMQTFATDQHCGVLHGDARSRGSQGSAQAVIIFETDPGLG